MTSNTHEDFQSGETNFLNDDDFDEEDEDDDEEELQVEDIIDLMREKKNKRLH